MVEPAEIANQKYHFIRPDSAARVMNFPAGVASLSPESVLPRSVVVGLYADAHEMMASHFRAIDTREPKAEALF